jgi:RND family efflux transporter MFP subunit
MSFIKQTVGVLVALAIAAAVWAVMAPASFWANYNRVAAYAGLAPAPLAANPGGAGAGPQGRGGRGGPRGATRVLTAEVVEAPRATVLQALGSAEAERSIVLFAQAGGPAREILFEAGKRVKADQELVRIDDEEQRIALEQVKIRLENAKAQLDRAERLAKSQAGTIVKVEDGRTAVRAVEADLAAAELALRRRTVRAPFDGVTGIPRISLGDMINTTTPLGTLDDRTNLLVRFAAPERFAARLAPGVKISATTAAYGDEVFAGEIEAVDSRVDLAARTLVVRARLPNKDDRLRPGMSFAVTVELLGEPRVAVPSLAIQWDRDGAFVWKVEKNRVRRVEVSVLERRADSVFVAGKLSAADRVVTEGVQMLRNGSEIESAETAEPRRQS